MAAAFAILLLLGLTSVHSRGRTGVFDERPSSTCRPFTDLELIEMFQPANLSAIYSAYHLRFNEDDLFKVTFRQGNSLRYIGPAQSWIRRYKQADGEYRLICRQVSNWKVPSRRNQPINDDTMTGFIIAHLTRSSDCSTTEAICFFTNGFKEDCLLDFLQHYPEQFPRIEWAPSPIIAPNLMSSARYLTVCLLAPPEESLFVALQQQVLVILLVIGLFLPCFLFCRLRFFCHRVQPEEDDTPIEERLSGGEGGSDPVARP